MENHELAACERKLRAVLNHYSTCIDNGRWVLEHVATNSKVLEEFDVHPFGTDRVLIVLTRNLPVGYKLKVTSIIGEMWKIYDREGDLKNATSLRAIQYLHKEYNQSIERETKGRFLEPLVDPDLSQFMLEYQYELLGRGIGA